MFRISFLKGVVVVIVITVVALPMYSVFYLYPTLSQFAIKASEDEAIIIARHLSEMLLKDGQFSGEPILEDSKTHIFALIQEFKILKIKAFDPQGKVLYSTDISDIGKINKERYFLNTVSKGRAYSKAIEKKGKTLEGQSLKVDVVETYVPLMRDGSFYGAFEIYRDITGLMDSLKAMAFRIYVITAIITLTLLTISVIALLKALKTANMMKIAEDNLSRKKEELEKANTELSILYEFSSKITKTIDLQKVFCIALDSIMEIKDFELERKGGIFLLEADRLRLLCHLGHSEEFLRLHKDLKIGDCLCGLAAQRQEVIISKNSEKDPRHTITYPDIKPHGHIIIPLRSPNRIIGVLYLYIPPDFEVSKGKIRLLKTIGSQIGTALENARLYEKTKSLSLRDPLTGLSNRRLMEIVLERLMEEGRRYQTPFSALMIDIDSFKKYNDTYGHSAGDALLLRISETIKDSIRSSDVPVRYGGEEFVVLLPKTDKKYASETAERIRREIAQRTPVSVSIGVASYNDSVSSGKEVIDRADFALYKAKQAGKNRVEIAVI